MAATESSTRAMAALDDLYRRHVGDVYRYTYAVLGNHADAEDVTQTTFVNALRALERGETPRNASHWLLAISHNLVRQRWRQAASRPTVVELVHDVPDEATEEENVELDGLVRALQRIPPSQREALVMRELEGRPYSEIAELLGITTSALETLLFRARRSLAEELENVVTCQNAELAISQRLDGRLSRKDRKRLEEHLADCPACAQLAKTQERQRKAFKGLAVLPIPIGLALFKGVPAASAAVVPIGAAASAGGVGATGVGAGGAVAAGSAAGAGGAVAGGTLLGGAAVKVAAVVVAATVATGVGYQGVKAVQDKPSKPAPTSTKATKEGTVGSGATEVRARPIVTRAITTNGAERRATPTSPVKARGTDGAPGQLKKVAGVSAGYGSSAAAKERAAEKKAERAVTPRGKDAAKDKPIARAPRVKPRPTPAPDAGSRPKPEPKPNPGQRPPAGSNDKDKSATPPAASSPPITEPTGPSSESSAGGSGQGSSGVPASGDAPASSPTASPSGEPPSAGSSTSQPPASSGPGSTTTAPDAVQGASDSRSGCPGAGNGPGSGSGCGIGNGNGQNKDQGKG
jgi:RNA polymerase sigma factor (sigma-70 family)